MNKLEKISFGAGLAVLASPAVAGPLAATPAPVAGVGVGAVLLIGMGYRALKRRIKP